MCHLTKIFFERVKRDVYLISHLDITQWNVEGSSDESEE